MPTAVEPSWVATTRPTARAACRAACCAACALPLLCVALPALALFLPCLAVLLPLCSPCALLVPRLVRVARTLATSQTRLAGEASERADVA